jgi:hypothetical protein
MRRFIINTLILAGLTGLVIVGFVLMVSWAFSGDDQPVHSEPVVLWRGRPVWLVDYSPHPGSYDNRLEWGDGERRTLLLKLGDTAPDLSVSADDQLVVEFRNYQDGYKLWQARFSNPDEPPQLTRR